jgi:hypothetical protein
MVRLIRLLVFCIFATGSLCNIEPIAAGTISVIPVATGLAVDPYDDPFGPVAGHLQISIGPGTLKEERAAMEFSLGLIPANKKIDSAVFTLFSYGGRAADAGVEAHGYVGNGTIEKADFLVNNRIAGPDGTMSPFTNPTDITAYVRQLYAGGATHLGLMLKVTKNAGREFGSELSDEGIRPLLKIEFSDKIAGVPEPGSVFLLSTGFMGVLGYRWGREIRYRR